MNFRNMVMGCYLLAAAVAVFPIALSADVISQRVDSTTTLAQLNTLATKGNADAMLKLGERLIQASGADAKPEEGVQWLQKAADAGKTEAWYDLGFAYANGLIGNKQDIPEAMKYFRKGADAGNADCQTSMGMLYQAGERIPGGVKTDSVEALKWYKLAAAQDHTDAIQHLGMMYITGRGVAQNDSTAVYWFRKGADLGDPECKWGLGQCHLDGRGVPQDSVRAYALFSAAVEGIHNPQERQAMSTERDKLGSALNAEQLKKAEPIIQEWKAKQGK